MNFQCSKCREVFTEADMEETLTRSLHQDRMEEPIYYYECPNCCNKEDVSDWSQPEPCEECHDYPCTCEN